MLESVIEDIFQCINDKKDVGVYTTACDVSKFTQALLNYDHIKIGLINISDDYKSEYYISVLYISDGILLFIEPCRQYSNGNEVILSSKNDIVYFDELCRADIIKHISSNKMYIYSLE
jgi:hypothetical protein